jgi:hypothetical protein
LRNALYRFSTSAVGLSFAIVREEFSNPGETTN